MRLFAALLALQLVAQALGHEDTKPGGSFGSDPAAFEEHLKKLLQKPEGGAVEVAGGVTVSELLQLRENNPEECSLAGLFNRWFTCEMVRPVEHVHLYCLGYLDKNARFCARQVLGRNPGQFDPIRRGFVSWSRKMRLSKKMRILWLGILAVPEGDLARMDRHLHWAIVPDGDPEPEGGKSLHFDLSPGERLERDQLMSMLGRVKHMDLKRTIAVLSQAKHKEETELVGGVTVADLVQMNDVSEEFCETTDEIIKRQKQCSKTYPMSNVYFFCRTSIRHLARVCQRAVTKQAEPDPWWQGLFEVIEHDDDHKVFSTKPEDKIALEHYLEKEPKIDEPVSSSNEATNDYEEGNK